MTEKDLKKFATNLDGSKFRELAAATVDFNCRNLDGTKITGTDRDNLIEAISLDYQTGSNFTKHKYLVGGSILGAVSVIGVLVIKKVLDRRKKEES